jgi:glycosyltransferase involved in cell wall biosynthesis
MRVVVALEGRFTLRDGRPASHHLTYERMWKRYLEVFDHVTVVGRLFPDEDRDAVPVEGPGVEFFALPGYTGPREYALHWPELQRRVRTLCGSAGAVILRVPGAVGGVVWQQLRRTARPYAVEVVGDPFDVLAPGSVRHPLRPLLRYWLPRQLRMQCREALGAAYVTEAALQRRYPCPAHMASYSDVVLPPEAFVEDPRPIRSGGPVRLVMVGDVNQLYKAPHVLIEAVARCVREGMDVRLTCVGKGTYLPWLKQRAAALGIDTRVEFTGRLPGGAAVRQVLDASDLFVLPSYQEGLPRAMIEAMARGLPCIGSSVGGIGELLAPEDMVPPGDAVLLARKIREVAGSAERRRAMSRRNLRVAAAYATTRCSERRTAFYRRVRHETEAHVRTRA